MRRVDLGCYVTNPEAAEPDPDEAARQWAYAHFGQRWHNGERVGPDGEPLTAQGGRTARIEYDDAYDARDSRYQRPARRQTPHERDMTATVQRLQDHDENVAAAAKAAAAARGALWRAARAIVTRPGYDGNRDRPSRSPEARKLAGIRARENKGLPLTPQQELQLLLHPRKVDR